MPIVRVFLRQIAMLYVPTVARHAGMVRRRVIALKILHRRPCTQWLILVITTFWRIDLIVQDPIQMEGMQETQFVGTATS